MSVQFFRLDAACIHVLKKQSGYSSRPLSRLFFMCLDHLNEAGNSEEVKFQLWVVEVTMAISVACSLTLSHFLTTHSCHYYC